MNAIALVNNQAAEMIKESQLDSSQLVHTIDRMIGDQTTLNKMAENAKKLGTPHAIDDIIKLVESI